MIGNLFKQIKRERKKANSWESANTCSEKEKEKKSNGGSCLPNFGWKKEKIKKKGKKGRE